MFARVCWLGRVRVRFVVALEEEKEEAEEEEAEEEKEAEEGVEA